MFSETARKDNLVAPQWEVLSIRNCEARFLVLSEDMLTETGEATADARQMSFDNADVRRL